MHERNPDTGQRYPSVLAMRSDRLRRWQSLNLIVPHFWWVQYEALFRSPERLIHDLARKVSLPKSNVFQNESFFAVDTGLGWLGENSSSESWDWDVHVISTVSIISSGSGSDWLTTVIGNSSM